MNCSLHQVSRESVLNQLNQGKAAYEVLNSMKWGCGQCTEATLPTVAEFHKRQVQEIKLVVRPKQEVVDVPIKKKSKRKEQGKELKIDAYKDFNDENDYDDTPQFEKFGRKRA